MGYIITYNDKNEITMINYMRVKRNTLSKFPN